MLTRPVTQFIPAPREAFRLICGENPLASLDLSNNTALQELSCNGNQFTSLDISNNTDIVELYIERMPTLNKVCVWTMPFPPDGIEIYTEGSPNVYFSTDCSK